MSEERILFKNISVMILSMIVPNIFNLVMVIVIARILLNSGMNDYNVVLSFVTMFLLFSEIGATGILIRDGSRDGSKISRYFGPYFMVRFTMICFMVLVCLVVSSFMPYEPRIKGYIIIMVLSQVIFQVAQIFASLFQARQKMEYIMYGNVIQAFLLLVIGLILVEPDLGNMGVSGLIYANLISNAVMLTINFIIASKELGKIKFNIDKDTFRYLFMAGIPIGVIGYLNIIYSYVDRFMLSILRYDQVANYTMPYTLVMSMSFILLAYSSSIFPTFSKIFNSANYIKYACEASFKYLTIFVIPMCIGGTLLADRIIYTMYGYDFANAIPVFRVLIWLLAFMIITYIGFPLMGSTHRERQYMWIMVISSTSNILLNIVLIPPLGATGSSIASLLTIGLLNATLTLLVIRNDIRGIAIYGTIVRVLIASAAMAASIIMINVNNLLLYILMGMAVYFLVFIAIGGISKSDMDLIRRILVRDDNSRLNKVFNLANKLLRV